MDFVVGLPRTLKKFDAVWVIVDRLTESAHFILVAATYSSERLAEIYICEIVRLHGVPVTIISDQGTQFTSHFWRAVQQSWGCCIHGWREGFAPSSPTKGVMRFGKKHKLRSRYIGPFEIFERVGEVTYKLALPPSLSVVHSVFHVSMLQKYHGDPSHVLDFKSVQLDKDLTYEEPVAILSMVGPEIVV
ncbi:uncharacterized protein [Nicotiana tomentosiformis]|uniref:uncharacterized protein n=1 Tax=Nicotiana tomentosiformis TaxID=4098 RepID=UPI00388C68E1